MTRRFNHPRLGTCSLELRTTSRSVTARWRNGQVHFIAPATITGPRLYDIIDRMAPGLLASRPATPDDLLVPGRKIDFDGFSIAIDRQSLLPSTVIGRPTMPALRVEIGTDFDLSATSTRTTVRKVIDNLLHSIAPKILLPRAQAIASHLGITGFTWHFGRGKRTLGTCSSRRIVRLSSQLSLYSSAVRDYIVCHELAHLTEMNHSAAFHDLCNRYCHAILSQPEPTLEKRFKAESRRLTELLP